jgi:hypothetical protein
MIEKLISFLKVLEVVIPPPKNCHHVVMYSQYGSDEIGWKDHLCLQVNYGGLFYPFFLDNLDFEKHENILVKEIQDLLNAPDANFQISTKAGTPGKV